MKLFKNILIGLITIVTAFACNNGIDGISPVDPGADGSGPVVNIIYPTEGTTVKVMEVITSIDIKLEITDDIEIGSISVLMDGNEIANFSTFTDYRRALEEFTYDQVTNGDHVLTVVATDLVGQSTTSEVNFTKEPPYTQLFDGEILYMPFDGDYMDLLNFIPATEVGTPSFAGESMIGTDAYQGTTDSYITYPVEGKFGDEFSASFWYKVSATPDRAGILVVGANADDRNQGFRLFREGNADKQRIKLNVGTGTGESWNDGEEIDVVAGEWIYITMTITPTKNTIYFNGVEMRSSDMAAAVDWTGCTTMTIGAGGETFSYWDHKSDSSPMDELRLFNKALTPAEIQNIMNVTNPYTPKYDGETFYMPFNGNNTELVSGADASMVGTTGFAGDGVDGDSFAGATDSYLTFPITGIFGDDFSAAFWYKVNPDPDRAGILVVGANVDDRNQGFRLFREGDATSQRIKLNVGFGTGESWNDGDVIDVTAGEWVHIAFTVSGSKSYIYINGVEVNSADMGANVDWTGCETLTIGAGGETFSYWGHLSDSSFIDELRIFNKALSQEEVQTIMND
ncbi:LamG-like jellyroll fold domain-containing protein [Ancylomarina longa]|uniref:LamG domain-containing protein n=1 Tax=Ancylomarina longa TaxID=2487017 RepID=A0A434AV01_9BACT|nr:LamG-like jellyroll fold domain-containing protein [Ancylomarina longa]RUT78265.1 LamG domain-containing protein [Ancylomarina longa]